MGSKRTIGDGLVVIKLSEHKTPQFREVTGRDWIYYGKNNDYPEYLLNLYNRSSKHNAIINQKAAYVLGGGDETTGETVVNGDGETLNDVMRKVIIDYELFNGFYLEIITAKAGGKIAEMRHVNFSHIRSNAENTKFYYTKKWTKQIYDDSDNITTLANSQPDLASDWEVYDAYSATAKRGKSLYCYKSYRPDLDTYTLPDYIGAIPYIETDFEIANYWYNAVKNGFTASHIVTFYGDAGTVEEQKKLEERIKKKFTGTDKAGRIILNFSQNKEKGGSEIANIIPQDLDKQFNILNETVQQEIFTGHRISSPMLFGIKTAGQLGGRSELIEANELFQNTYVNPRQGIFNKIFSNLMADFGVKKGVELMKLVPIGLDLVSNNNAWSILTEDEKREVIGKEPLSDEEKVQKEEKDAEKQKEMDKKQGKYSSHKNFVNVFKKFGSQRQGKLIDSRPLSFEDTINLRHSEEKFADLRPNQLAILDLLTKDPLMPPDEISKVLNISEKRVSTIIASLITKKLITPSSVVSGDTKVPSNTPVPKAAKILEDTPAPTEEIFVAYSYEWRDGFSDEDADSSRDFCLELMAESESRKASGSLWTREDIESISAETGWNVWEMRGGWYTKPNTDVHLPFCRHVWVQNLYSTSDNG